MMKSKTPSQVEAWQGGISARLCTQINSETRTITIPIRLPGLLLTGDY